MRSPYQVIIVLFSMFILAPAVVLGQAGVCPALVEKALTALSQNCADLSRNSACYGYNRVDATFSEVVPDTTFSQPADRAKLKTLQTLQTTPLDTDQDRWGVAVLNVQANVPNSLPGQAVTFMLLGDVKVENAVASDQAIDEVNPLTVTILTAANLRSAPSLKANVIASVSVNTELPADGLSTDGEWLRVLYDGGAAWLNRQLVQTSADLNTLPVISQDRRSPMQAFYFTTGTGQPQCNEAPPSALLVQGPDKVRVDINANGADITIGSTILLWLLPDGKMQLIVISGEVQVGGVTIPAGFTIFIDLQADPDHPGHFMIDGKWSDLRPLTPEELDKLQPLSRIDPRLLHYAISIPTEEDIQEAINKLANAQNASTQNDGACGGFKPTSPIGGLPYSTVTFYWDPMPNATGYRFHLYNDGGATITAIDTPNTSVSLDATANGIGGGTNFSWLVEALGNGEVLCSTGKVGLVRQGDPTLGDAPPPSQPNAPKPYCGDGICQITTDTCRCLADCPKGVPPC